MRMTLAALLPLLLLLPLAGPARAQAAAQCREAKDQALATFRSTLAPMSERDREGARTLIAELERLVRDRRAAGTDDCVIWRKINRRVFSSRASAPPCGSVRGPVPCPCRDTVVPSEVLPPTPAPDRA